MLRSEQRFKKSESHNLFTEKINKIALSSDDDKRLQTFDGIHMAYPWHIICVWHKLWKSVQNRIDEVYKKKN